MDCSADVELSIIIKIPERYGSGATTEVNGTWYVEPTRVCKQNRDLRIWRTESESFKLRGLAYHRCSYLPEQ